MNNYFFKKDITAKDEPVHFVYLRTQVQTPSTFLRHIHSHYEMSLFLSEESSYVIEDKKYAIEPYTLLLIPPYKYHFSLIEKEEQHCRYIVAFHPSTVDPSLLHSVFREPVCYQLNEGHPIVQTFQRFHHFSQANLKEHNTLMRKTFCTELLLGILILQQELRMVKHPIEQLLHYPVLEYVENNLTEIRSLEEIAEHFFMSTSSLTRQFKTKMGISLMKYIRQKKLLLANALLENGEKPLEVSIKCGFNDYTTFYKAYVGFFGSAPSGNK